MRAAKDRSYIGLDCDNTRADNPCGIGKQPRRASPFSYAVARASSRRNYRECDSRLAFSHSVQAAPELSSFPLSPASAALSHSSSPPPPSRARAHLIFFCEFTSLDRGRLDAALQLSRGDTWALRMPRDLIQASMSGSFITDLESFLKVETGVLPSLTRE